MPLQGLYISKYSQNIRYQCIWKKGPCLAFLRRKFRTFSFLFPHPHATPTPPPLLGNSSETRLLVRIFQQGAAFH